MKIEIESKSQEEFFDAVQSVGVDNASAAIGNRIIEVMLGEKVCFSHSLGFSFYGLQVVEVPLSANQETTDD